MAQEYEEKEVSQLLYNKTPKLISSISERRTEVYFPRGPRGGYGENDTIEFDIANDALLDLNTFVLQFKLMVTTAAAAGNRHNIRISNALDCIKGIAVFYNEVEMENLNDNANTWANALLAYNANASFFAGDGSIYLGNNSLISNIDLHSSQPIIRDVANVLVAGSASIDRVFSIPLGFLGGVFNMANHLPMFGNKLKIRFTLDSRLKVVSRPQHVDDFYKLDDVVIRGDTVIVKSDFRDEIVREMNSASGFRISYTTHSLSKHSCAASTRQYIRQTFNLANALSLHMLVDNKAAKIMVPGRYTHYCQSAPLAGFKNLKVKSGSKWFTDQNGISSHTDLFSSVEKCMNGLTSLAGNGVVPYNVYAGSYFRPDLVGVRSLAFNNTAAELAVVAANGVIHGARPAVPVGSVYALLPAEDLVLKLAAELASPAMSAGSTYGHCMLSVNLEKAILDDNDPAVLNSGISSIQNGSSNQFDIELLTSDVLADTSDILIDIVHRRNLLIQNGTFTVEGA